MRNLFIKEKIIKKYFIELIFSFFLTKFNKFLFSIKIIVGIVVFVKKQVELDSKIQIINQVDNLTKNLKVFFFR